MKLEYTSRLGWPILIILSTAPLLIWSVAPYSFDKRFLANGVFDPKLTMTSLGQALGLVGMAMFSLNFALSARLKWMESFFGGMNKIYIAHHILGGLAFILLLLHPLFIVGRYVVDGGAALGAMLVSFVAHPACYVHLRFFAPECSTLWGVVGLALMIVFLYITFFVKLPYQTWKLTHQFLGLAFFFGALHVLTIPSDVAVVVALKYYMFALIAIGFLGIFYRTLLGFIFVPRVEYVVSDVQQINKNIVEIRLLPKHPKRRIIHKPGQFVFVGFPDVTGLQEVHPFSISSSPDNNHLTLGVKALGDFTSRLRELQPGMRAIIEGPFGRTSYVYYPRKEHIWIAGGIGITPFLGMARSLRQDDGYKVDLYYSAATAEDAAFDAELRDIARKNPNFRLIPWYGQEKGFLNAEAIVKESQGVIGKEIFLCGPPPMMKALREQFMKWKVPVRRIHSEEFALS